jgi:hypothetical protein
VVGIDAATENISVAYSHALNEPEFSVARLQSVELLKQNFAHQIPHQLSFLHSPVGNCHISFFCLVIFKKNRKLGGTTASFRRSLCIGGNRACRKCSRICCQLENFGESKKKKKSFGAINFLLYCSQVGSCLLAL